MVALAALLLALAPATAVADGGRVVASGAAGPFTVTLFASPAPVRAGDADLSVLVQDAEGRPLLDADVDLLLRRPGDAAARRVPATGRAATNRLLYAAPVPLPDPGTWRVEVAVRRGTGTGTLAAALDVGPRRSPLAAHWPWLVLPPVAIALFALGERLARRRG
jgi:FixH